MAAVTIAMVLVIAGVWFALQVYPIFAGRGREVVVTVHLGDSLSTIASELHAAGVIASPFAFRIDDLVQGTPIIRAGSYKLRQGSSFSTIRHVLESRPNVFQLTVLPGLTLHEIATLVAGDRGSSFATSFLHDATASLTPSPYAHGQSLEGLIGARTYFVSASTTPRELIHEMVRDFNRQASTVGLTPSTSLHGLDAYQLIVTASIVEKE
ncbi:MAG: endolytic transglycosylase MltG, partial [Acidimicrobiales bacterium]